MPAKKSTAFFRALASILFVACRATALQADLLATVDGHRHANVQDRYGAALTISYGSDFVGHENFQSIECNLRLGHKDGLVFRV